MKILGHIHTFNDEDVIERSFQALRAQTYPLNEILVVDNGSTDGTLEKLASQPVTLVRHRFNEGTSGAVVSGFRYALDNGYDWLWIFDADSAPRPDALEKLVEFYRGLPPERQAEVWLLASLRVDSSGQRVSYESSFTLEGFSVLDPDGNEPFLRFDSTIWSGSFYKLEAVRKVGLPSKDYVLDWGEHEYGYRGKRAGYRAYLYEESIVQHNIGGEPGLHFRSYKIGPIAITMREFPPIRCYYLVRNLLYFWLYVYHVRTVRTLSVCFIRVTKLTLSFLLRPFSHRKELAACLRGVWDGVTANVGRRY